MGFYTNRILPHLIHLSMRQDTFNEYRQRIVGAARGRVLEVGIGSGLNLPVYANTVEHVIGLDPSTRLLSMARSVSPSAGNLSVELIQGSAQAIPLDDRSVDTVVMTWTLCSIPDAQAALREMRRVLSSSGRLLFVEHGRSPEARVSRWQDRLTPLWKRIGGGCHLNRPVRDLLERSGFEIEELATGYMEGPKPMTFMYEGRARPA